MQFRTLCGQYDVNLLNWSDPDGENRSFQVSVQCDENGCKRILLGQRSEADYLGNEEHEGVLVPRFEPKAKVRYLWELVAELNMERVTLSYFAILHRLGLS